MSVLTKLIYKYNAIPIKPSAEVFCRKQQAKSRSTWKIKGHRVAKRTLKKNKVKNLNYLTSWNYHDSDNYVKIIKTV